MTVMVGTLRGSVAGHLRSVWVSFVHRDLACLLDWFAEQGADGLLFVGEKGAPFGRKWRKARAEVGLPADFRFCWSCCTDTQQAGDNGGLTSAPVARQCADSMIRNRCAGEKAMAPPASWSPQPLRRAHTG